MAESRDSPGSVATVRVTLDGAPRLLALSWIPELQWFVASAVDLSTAQVVEVRPLLPAIGLFLVLFLLLIGGGAWLVEKRVLAAAPATPQRPCAGGRAVRRAAAAASP